MDSKNTLTSKLSIFQRLPIFGIIFVLIASAAFYLCRTQHEQAWLPIYNYYSENLLQQEKNLYQDFYSKRLSIEKKGTEPELTHIKQTISQQDHESLSQIILSDRSFREFLIQKAPIYFSPEKQASWSAHNKHLITQLASLPEYQFAIIPELFIASPMFANLFTYLFVDRQLLNFLSNIFVFLCLCIIIERQVRRGRFFAFILGSSILFSSLYIFIADSFSPPLMALNNTLYLLGLMACLFFLKHHYQAKCSRSKLFLLIGLVLFFSKALLDFYLNIFNQDFLICLIIVCICGALITWFYPQFIKPLYIKPIIETPNSGLIKTQHLPSSGRKKYSEALLGLSRFNFDYSRKLIRNLREEYPDSLNILESSYHLEKLQTDEANFWPLAEARIEHCLISQNYHDMLTTFQDIQKAAPNRQLASRHISPEHYLKMLVLFLQHGDIEKAEHAFMFLELAGKPSLVKDACKLLIDIFSQKQKLKKQEHYQALFDSYLEAN